MREETCILCGRPAPTGLQILGCLICFPCEKELLSPDPPERFRRLGLLYELSPRKRRA